MTTITVEREWLKQLHRDLDACQKLIWANLRGCDPAYCGDAQARLAEIDALLSEQPQADHSAQDLNMVEQPQAVAGQDARSASEWFSLVMNAAAEIEDAANCLRDEEAKKKAIGAASYYRAQANSAPQPPARHDQGDEVLRDAQRYRYMRAHAIFERRNGPGLYWYLPRNLTGGAANQLDQAIDAALTQSPKGEEE